MNRGKPAKAKGPAIMYPNQLPGESEKAYVCRVYMKDFDESEADYMMKILTKYSTETDEAYKSRIELIATTFSQYKIMEKCKYDDKKKLYVYKQAAKVKNVSKLFQGQLPNEANDVYVRRVYGRKSGEADDDYYLRIVSKYSNEGEKEYKDRIALIQEVLVELPLREKIIYDDHAKMYIYIRSSVAGSSSGYPGQLQNESEETYVRRVYTRKTTESEKEYYMRITSRYSSETDQSYKSRVTLIFKIFTDISIENVKYDETRKLYVYVQPSNAKQGKKPAGGGKGHPGQQPNESDEDYVKRVYAKKTEETVEKYIMRVTSRYSSETDESYKCRVELIITIIKEVNIREYIRYDEEKRLYVYVKSGKTDKKKPVEQKNVPQQVEEKKPYPNQQPDESDEDYVKRLYAKKTEETEEKYITRITSRYASETDESYKCRIELIVTTIKEVNIREYIKYDETLHVYVYVKPKKTEKKKPGDQKNAPQKVGEKKPYPNQLPDETDEAYVRRLYSKEQDETDDVYILRILTRYSNETDELYKSRIQLIITVIKEVKIQEHIKYDEKRKLFVYMRPATPGAKPEGPPPKYPNQKPGEDDEAYVRRVYSKKADETEEMYIMRVLGRYSSETDESYKSRVQLVIKVIKEVNIQEHIRYDETKKMYVVVKKITVENKKEPEVITIEVDNYEGQLDEEDDEEFVLRVYSKKPDESEEKYIKRIIAKSATESDDMYKSRVELITTVITEVNISQCIKYDDKKQMFVYVKPGKGQGQTTKQITKTVTQTTETQICTQVGGSYITED